VPFGRRLRPLPPLEMLPSHPPGKSTPQPDPHGSPREGGRASREFRRSATYGTSETTLGEPGVEGQAKSDVGVVVPQPGALVQGLGSLRGMVRGWSVEQPGIGAKAGSSLKSYNPTSAQGLAACSGRRCPACAGSSSLVCVPRRWLPSDSLLGPARSSAAAPVFQCTPPGRGERVPVEKEDRRHGGPDGRREEQLQRNAHRLPPMQLCLTSQWPPEGGRGLRCVRLPAGQTSSTSRPGLPREGARPARLREGAPPGRRGACPGFRP
jgi:hypothetical protein